MSYEHPRAWIDDDLRNHRVSEQRDAEGWEPQDVRDLEDETFDGCIHATGELPVVLGLLCEAMPTAAEDAAFAGETGEPPECGCGSGLLAIHSGECLICWFNRNPVTP